MSPLCDYAGTHPVLSHGHGMGYHIPESFFMDLDDTPPSRNVFGNQEGKHGWTPSGAMAWYDGIIDDILANPGTSLTDTAKRLGRSPSTVQTIAASDMFKARFAQRRAAFEAELNRRIVAKMTKTAELALDITIETMEKKRDAIPLPVLNELAKTTLDRLGYSPKAEGAAPVNVQVNTNVVSAEALAQAREKLKLVEGSPAPAGPREASVRQHDPPDPVAGQGEVEGEED